MLPSFPEFKKFTAADAPLLAKALRAVPRVACEFSAANLVAWDDFDQPAYTFIDGFLCLRITPLDEEPFFLEPLGTGDPRRAVDACLNQIGRISRASGPCAAEAAARGCAVAPIADHFDYLYRTRDLAELKGRKFDGKRNHIRRFERACPRAQLRPLRADDGPQALALFDAWCEERRSEQPDLPELAWTSQRRAIGRAFEHFGALRLIGSCLRHDEKTIGFVIGSELLPEVACLHFSHADPTIPGASQAILREACRTAFSRFDFINLEQDLGLAGLRKIKHSYHPHRIEEKFEISPLGGRRGGNKILANVRTIR